MTDKEKLRKIRELFDRLDAGNIRTECPLSEVDFVEEVGRVLKSSWAVEVKQIVNDDEITELDRKTWGLLGCDGVKRVVVGEFSTEREAADYFHATYPIDVLEHYSVDFLEALETLQVSEGFIDSFSELVSSDDPLVEEVSEAFSNYVKSTVDEGLRKSEFVRRTLAMMEEATTPTESGETSKEPTSPK